MPVRTYVTTLGTGIRESWRRHRRFLHAMNLGFLVVALLAAWAGRGLYFYTDFREDGKRFAGLMTVASSFSLITFAVLLHFAGMQIARRVGWSRVPVAWIALGAFGVWLAADELVMLHETGVRMLVRAGVPRFLWVVDQDFYIFAVYGLVLLVALAVLVPDLQRRGHTLGPLALAVTGFLTSQALDSLPWDALAPWVRQVVGTAEEMFKCFGTFNLAVFGWLVAGSSMEPNEGVPGDKHRPAATGA